MLRGISLLHSKAFHNSGPFLDGALQLIKLHLAHKNAQADGNSTACRAIESEFLRELEAFRPCFTISSSLQVAKLYTKKLHGAMSHFHLHDDPLMRQLDLILGKQSMRQASNCYGGIFKVPVGSQPVAFSSQEEKEETVLPTELPHPPKPDPLIPPREGALKLPARHRGHWVLRDPEIAITRAERRSDPWYHIMTDAYMPIMMTSGVPCVLTSTSFPEALSVESNELVSDGGLQWVHEKAKLLGDVHLSGLFLAEAMVVVRGDIASVKLADAVVLREKCVLRPPLRALLNQTVAESSPLTVGSATVIGRQTVCEAQSVGSYVLVEDNCVIGEWVEIPDGVWLRSGCVVPAGMRLAPYVVYEGRPARPAASLDAELHQIFMMDRVYEVFSTPTDPLT